MNRFKVTIGLLVLSMCLPFASGCFSAMSWQTADTVPKGGVELGFGWSLAYMDRIRYTDESGTSTSEGDDALHGTLPNPFPDIYMRFGLMDNLDIGFRLFWLGIQSDVKIRLVNSDVFSLAIAPGLGYSRPFLIFGEYFLDVPLLLTFKLGEYVKLYASGHARVSGWRIDLLGVDESEDIHAFGAGANLGFQFGTKRWFIRPEVAYMNYFLGFEEKCRGDLEFSWFTFGLGFGFTFGVEDDIQDDKIKKLEDRIEQLENERKIPPSPPADKPAPGDGTNVDEVRERADEAAKDLEKEEEKRENE
jgi:hypothetical protein